MFRAAKIIYMKYIKIILSSLLITLCLTGCGFDLSSNGNTIELPNTYGINVEAVFQTPDFFMKHTVKFDEVMVNYTVRKNDAFAATVKIYVSAEQTADAIEMPGDEDVINVTLGVNENEKSGSVSCQLIKDIVNAKQPYFVLGAQNLSVSPISSVYVDLDIHFKGTWQL